MILPLLVPAGIVCTGYELPSPELVLHRLKQRAVDECRICPRSKPMLIKLDGTIKVLPRRLFRKIIEINQ